MEHKYLIVGDGSYGHKLIKPQGKGSVPKELRGTFTNEAQAIRAITSYKSKEESVVGKSKRNSGK